MHVHACHLALAAAFTVACLTARLCIAIAPRIGFLDHPGDRKKHRVSTPLLGGLAVLAGGAAGLSLLVAAHMLVPRSLALWFAAGMPAVLLGLWDDRRPLSPIPKLTGMIVAAVVPAIAALLLGCATMQTAALLVCALMFFSNSFNLLDNSDGHCASIAAAACAVLAMLQGSRSALAVAAACTGFLAWNWPRARIFMGDTGSLLIGAWVVLAGMLQDSSGRLLPVLPLVAVWVPVYDTLSVVVVRMHEGRSVMQGGQDHFSHRLMRRGLGTAAVNVLLAGATLGAGAIAMALPPPWQPWVAVAFICAAGIFEICMPRDPGGCSCQCASLSV